MLPHQAGRDGGPITETGFGSRQPGFETSEVRWFGRGPLPAPLVDWFTSVPSIVEHRCDTYRLDGSFDLGVKRRNGSGLEAKVRRGSSGLVTLAEGVSAEIEEWVKLYGVDIASLPGDPRSAWVEVDKVVASRIYRPDEAGLAVLMTRRDLEAPGCDVELAAVSIGDHEAWTFALEAWGSYDVRRHLLDATAVTLQQEDAPPEFLMGLERAMGYPEWLAVVASVRS